MNAMPPVDDPRDVSAHHDGRRLRFANEIDPEESIPGWDREQAMGLLKLG